MRYALVFIVFISLLLSCNPRHPDLNPVGTWENSTPWNGNHTTLTVRDDSIMLFKTEKPMDGAPRFLIACGRWHVEEDSFLVMEPGTRGVSWTLNGMFPELTQIPGEQITLIEVSARLIMRDTLLYDLKADGSAEPAHTYRKVSE